MPNLTAQIATAIAIQTGRASINRAGHRTMAGGEHGDGKYGSEVTDIEKHCLIHLNDWVEKHKAQGTFEPVYRSQFEPDKQLGEWLFSFESGVTLRFLSLIRGTLLELKRHHQIILTGAWNPALQTWDDVISTNQANQNQIFLLTKIRIPKLKSQHRNQKRRVALQVCLRKLGIWTTKKTD